MYKAKKELSEVLELEELESFQSLIDGINQNNNSIQDLKAEFEVKCSKFEDIISNHNYL